MFLLFVLPALLQIALPLWLLAWQAAGRDTNLIAWLLKHGAIWSYIYTTSLAGLWLVVPWYVPHLLLVTSIALAARTLPEAFRFWRTPAGVRQWLDLAARACALALSAAALSMSLQGRKPPERTFVDLSFPLRSGDYYIVNGGSTELVNAHVKTLTGERFGKYRGQSYGVDILELNWLGVRASGPARRNPAEYAIFDDVIYAPCEGIVVRSEDGLPDLQPPETDRTHMPGNFVLLECGGSGEFQVLLGHMRRGSVRVHPGDYVTLDTRVGNVGNSGNSNEPHLHIHAQRPGKLWDPFSSDPLQIRLDGRYLARNDRVSKFSASCEKSPDLTND